MPENPRAVRSPLNRRHRELYRSRRVFPFDSGPGQSTRKRSKSRWLLISAASGGIPRRCEPLRNAWRASLKLRVRIAWMVPVAQWALRPRRRRCAECASPNRFGSSRAWVVAVGPELDAARIALHQALPCHPVAELCDHHLSAHCVRRCPDRHHLAVVEPHAVHAVATYSVMCAQDDAWYYHMLENHRHHPSIRAPIAV